jgi:hypothetical protein
MKRLSTAVLLTLVLLVSIPSAFAQSGGGYDLTWSTVSGGGWTFSTGGAYTLGGTIGQPGAGLLAGVASGGGAYTLGGGFWGGGALAGEYRAYLPLVLRNSDTR